METIRNYIENIFSTLPKDQKILDLKNELLNNMLDKYNELKADGKTENEAIGIVISEFGNIDELLNEMDISIPASKSSDPIVTLEESTKFINLKTAAGKLTALGVSLILWGVSILVTLTALTDSKIIFKEMGSNFNDTFSVVILLIFVASAVCLFILSGFKLKSYNYIEKGRFELDSYAYNTLNKDYLDFRNKKFKCTIIGVTLCILSPITCIVGNILNDFYTELGASLLLIIISIAVSLFIYSGTIGDAYKKLLKKGDFDPVKREENKVIDAISHIVWSIATCIFLFLGFVFNLWHICWIVYPITGILYGGFRALYSALNNKNGAGL